MLFWIGGVWLLVSVLVGWGWSRIKCALRDD